MTDTTKQEKHVLSIAFGALVDPLVKQLRDAGICITPELGKKILVWQAHAHAITRLAVNGILPESEVKTARKRLLKTIIRGLETKG